MIDTTLDRTAERVAYILQRQQNAVAPMPGELRPAPVRPPRRDLGPNQLAWLRANVPSFEICERLANESEAHRKRLAEAVRVGAGG